MDGWGRRLWYDFAYLLTMAGYSLGFSLRTEGSRHVPHNGPALLVANHQSFLDPVAIGLVARRHLCYLARKTLFAHPTFGAFLRSVNCVPVDQEGIAKEGLRTVLELLQHGRAVLVFPEGERTYTGAMNPLRPGIHLLIKRGQAPIIPVGIAGAFEAFPRMRKLPRPCPLFWPATGTGGLAVSIGRPLDPARYDGVPREQVLADLAAKFRPCSSGPSACGASRDGYKINLLRSSFCNISASRPRT